MTIGSGSMKDEMLTPIIKNSSVSKNLYLCKISWTQRLAKLVIGTVSGCLFLSTQPLHTQPPSGHHLSEYHSFESRACIDVPTYAFDDLLRCLWDLVFPPATSSLL
jgi:hypothetical protein